MREVDWHL